ncbi:MAG: hypothetical protein IIA92_05190 [Chloroflexi bacterium]|nr:hypothetical protein [Chloroflexota bacterium]
MILFFDRSVGVTIPRILQSRDLRFPLQVEYHETHFAMDEEDDVWLPQVGQRGWTVVGHDYSYHTKLNELSAIKQYDIGCFYLWGSESPRWQKLQCFARAFDRMVVLDANTPRPFIYRVGQTGRFTSVYIP